MYLNYSDPMQVTTCGGCGEAVPFADTVIVSAKVEPAPEHRGMVTHVERRLCAGCAMACGS